MPVTVKGLDKLIKRIDDYPVAVQKAVDNECKAGALKIRDLAVNLAPVDEGPLRRSIGVKFAPFKSTVFANIFYAPYIEWGTGRKVKVDGGAERKAYALTFKKTRLTEGIRPQPFFFRALDALAPEILRNIQKAIKKA